MRIPEIKLSSRRKFLVQSTQLAFAGAGLPVALNLSAIGNAAAFNATDYKALVCIFLAGGNDQDNTVVNYDIDSYNAYKAARGSIALNRQAVLPLGGVLNNPSRQYGLHPAMTGIQRLYQEGKASVLLNVGPLVAPMNKSQYLDRSGSFPRPPQLFSHNDQAAIWQCGEPEGATVGWGGQIGDLALAGNAASSTFTCMSLAGNTAYLAGKSAVMYQGSASSGAVKINAASDPSFGSTFIAAAVSKLIQQPSAHLLENEYSRVTKRAMAAEAAVIRAISTPDSINARDGGGNATNPKFAPFTAAVLESNELASALEMVARIIAGRDSLGAKRQVFYIAVGGYDLHDNLVAGQQKNMQNLSRALTAFVDTTKLLGVDGNVTAFTASDFGRTLSSNGDGSDHGWGGHHLVVGGAVDGGKIHGYAPPVSAGNAPDGADAWQVGQGRLLPTTSVDQYAATLAKWFGVQDTELDVIFPNLKNFKGQTQSAINYPRTLGFMKAG
jgi:uncharacterized protein (DUF1501 family)